MFILIFKIDQLYHKRISNEKLLACLLQNVHTDRFVQYKLNPSFCGFHLDWIVAKRGHCYHRALSERFESDRGLLLLHVFEPVLLRA